MWESQYKRMLKFQGIGDILNGQYFLQLVKTAKATYMAGLRICSSRVQAVAKLKNRSYFTARSPFEIYSCHQGRGR